MTAAVSEMSQRIPALTTVQSWDYTGSLPAPPIVDYDVARNVVVQNAEFLLIADFIHRSDDLGLAPQGNLPHPLHHEGQQFYPDRPVAAVNFSRSAECPCSERWHSTTACRPGSSIGRTMR